jgi:hypothetical protein
LRQPFTDQHLPDSGRQDAEESRKALEAGTGENQPGSCAAFSETSSSPSPVVRLKNFTIELSNSRTSQLTIKRDFTC